MGRKQKSRRLFDDDVAPVNEHLSFGDDGEIVEERKPQPKPVVTSRPSFSPKPGYKARHGDSSHLNEDGLPGPSPKKKFKLDPKPELIAFRKDLPIYSGTSHCPSCLF